MKIPEEALHQPKFVWTHLDISRPVAAALLFLAAAIYALTCDPSGKQSSQLSAVSTISTILSRSGDRGVFPAALLRSLCRQDPSRVNGSSKKGRLASPIHETQSYDSQGYSY